MPPEPTPPQTTQTTTYTESTGVPSAARAFIGLLEKQGLAVVLVAFGVAWASGWVPFKLCEPQTSQDRVIAAMESDRRMVIAAVNKIAESTAETAQAVARIDARDAIKTCAAVPDKEARLACIQVAVSGATQR